MSVLYRAMDDDEHIIHLRQAEEQKKRKWKENNNNLSFDVGERVVGYVPVDGQISFLIVLFGACRWNTTNTKRERERILPDSFLLFYRQ